MSDPQRQRPIRSYVLRAGRMTPAQQRAFDQNWRRWGLEHSAGLLDCDAVFSGSSAALGSDAPAVLEIGFGMGHSLVAMAAAAPRTRFIGVEVHRPGVGKLLHGMEERGVDNIRVYCHDAVEVLTDCIADASLDTIQVFFPDPWHKKRHHKRRLIQPAFVDLLTRKLKSGGVLHLATDWENYAEQMMAVLEEAQGLVNACSPGQFAPRPEHRPLTKFEARGERLGHGVWDLIFRRT
jgi:tRNA (guanine-N7-)-methyltransferase